MHFTMPSPHGKTQQQQQQQQQKENTLLISGLRALLLFALQHTIYS